jgi:ParB-like chromosome segregation protein Spo0J
MPPQEYAAFAADIEARGIQVPLEITAEGALLDGRHRLRAASELGIERLPVRIVAPADPHEHVLLASPFGVPSRAFTCAVAPQSPR